MSHIHTKEYPLVDPISLLCYALHGLMRHFRSDRMFTVHDTYSDTMFLVTELLFFYRQYSSRDLSLRSHVNGFCKR
jgi:hypothetical protein